MRWFKFKGTRNTIDSMSQAIRKQNKNKTKQKKKKKKKKKKWGSEIVDAALIYVCIAFLREFNTPAHLRHCEKDSSEVKSRQDQMTKIYIPVSLL